MEDSPASYQGGHPRLHYRQDHRCASTQSRALADDICHLCVCNMHSALSPSAARCAIDASSIFTYLATAKVLARARARARLTQPTLNSPLHHLQLSSDEAMLVSEHLLIQKMNMLIVGILKHDWPAAWPEFIPTIVAASKLVCVSTIEW